MASNCIVCGTELEGGRRKASYCGANCRQSAYRSRKAFWRKVEELPILANSVLEHSKSGIGADGANIAELRTNVLTTIDTLHTLLDRLPGCGTLEYSAEHEAIFIQSELPWEGDQDYD